MEPRHDLHFCTTSDGVTIACAVTGQGPTLVRVGTWISHLECDLAEPDVWATIDALSRHHRFVRYDPRGCGLSSRLPSTLTFDALVSDLEAVVDQLAPTGQVALLGLSCAAPVAVAYAARHPERVSSLVVVNGYGRAYFSAASAPPHLLEEAKLLLASARQGWGQEKSPFRQIFIQQLLGARGSEPDVRRRIGERMRLSMTPDMAERYLDLNYRMDVKAQCALLQCPTLVFHARDDQMVGLEQGRKLAAWIPGARFVTLEGDAHILPVEHGAFRVFIAETLAFLGNPAEADRPRLSRRQTEILRLVAQGYTDKQVAREIGLSPRTVEMHVALALRALASSNRTEAVRRATECGLLAAELR